MVTIFQLYQASQPAEIVFSKSLAMFTLEFSENLICAEALLGSEVQGSQLVASKSKESYWNCVDICVSGLNGQILPILSHIRINQSSC